ncbi:MAG: DUF1592 domain-containing protein [Myxococcales bacterium]|nr:DUF1592 domain-containing protein [Myxococcales bacterium]
MKKFLLTMGLSAAVSIANFWAEDTSYAQSIGCNVDYQVESQWNVGFTAQLVVTNLGDTINGWTLSWTFANGQTINDSWNSTLRSGGPNVELENAAWNRTIPSGGNISFGFNGALNGSGTNSIPTSFSLNGVRCNGSIDNPSDGPTLWAENCQGCHGSFSGGNPVSSGPIAINVNNAVERRGDGLESFIEASMPSNAPGDCVGECSELVGEYLRQFVTEVEPAPDGETLWAENCQGCHGSFTDDNPVSSGRIAININDAVGRRGDGLESFIETSMPSRSPEDCVGECSVLVGEYMRQFVTDIDLSADGETLWTENCQRCHGSFTPGSSVSSGPNRLDINAAIEQRGATLEAYISSSMPAGAAGDCVGECSELVGEYIRQFASDGPMECEENAQIFGSRVIKVLSSQEYQKSLEDLLGINENYGESVAIYDGYRGGFSNMVDRDLSGTSLETYVANAESIANWAVNNGRPFDCNNNSTCARRFVDEFLFTAFRGLVTEDQKDEYRQLFNQYPSDGLRIALQTALSSPYFLYRIETGVPAATARQRGYYDPDQPNSGSPAELLQNISNDTYVLSPHELVSALSFRLTGSTPSYELLQAASSITTPAQLSQQVERLLDSPRGRSHLKTFVTEWFHLKNLKDIVRSADTGLNSEVKEAMLSEVHEHFAHVFYNNTVPFSEFYDGNYTFLNRTLANFYGIQGNFGSQFARTVVQGRGGPIASGAFMASHAHIERTSPILRAVHARQSALCHYIDPPDSPLGGPDIAAQRAAAQQAVEEQEAREGVLSSRDFYFLFTDNVDACAVCHEQIINPMFGLEDFDNVGRRRPSAGQNMVTETIRGQRKTVSLSGTLYGVNSTSDSQVIEYAGAKDFSNKIAQTDQINVCLVRRSFRFLTGWAYEERDLDAEARESIPADRREAYSCVASEAMSTFANANHSPRVLFRELATSPLMLFRK